MAHLQPPTETDLITAYRAGDRGAIADIYDRYSSEVFSSFHAKGLSREEAAEMTYETFLEAASRLEERPPPEDLGPWLLEIAAGFGGSAVSEVQDMDDDDLVAPPPALRPRVVNKVERGIASASFVDGYRLRLGSMGVFVIVTLLLGLLGWAISAQFDPLDPPATAPATQPSPEVASPTATTTPAIPSTTVPGTTPSSTAAAAPASFQVSTESIDFGSDGTVAEFELRNTGAQAGTWGVAASNPAIALSAGEGELAGGESVVIEMSMDRETIRDGDIAENITVTWSGGEVVIPVTGTHDANPIIHNPQVSPASVQVSGAAQCANTQSNISARIRDASPLESVVVRWSPDGSTQQEAEMTTSGEDIYRGVVGPFTTVQTATLKIVAFDERGNAGGANMTLTVVACP